MISRKTLLITSVLLFGIGLTFVVVWFVSQNRNEKNEIDDIPGTGLTLTYVASLPPVDVNTATLEAGIIVGPSYLLAYPAPNSVLSVTDYYRGLLQNIDANTTERFNICVYTEVLRGRDDRVCGPPPGTTVTPNPNCQTLTYLKGTDFQPYINIFLNGEKIDGESLGEENVAVIPGRLDDDAYILCYRVPLESGLHTMRYEFEWVPENISNIEEWTFTLTP